MKILFLDVDGVLNKDADFKHPMTPPNNGYKVLNFGLVNKLEQFVVENGVTIVWSSTWRLYPDQMDYILQYTTLRNYEHDDYRTIRLNETWDMDHNTRGREVQEWLVRHKGEVTHWAILDDIEQFLDDQQLNFVRTDEELGVTDDNIRKLKEILTD